MWIWRFLLEELFSKAPAKLYFLWKKDTVTYKRPCSVQEALLKPGYLCMKTILVLHTSPNVSSPRQGELHVNSA